MKKQFLSLLVIVLVFGVYNMAYGKTKFVSSTLFPVSQEIYVSYDDKTAPSVISGKIVSFVGDDGTAYINPRVIKDLLDEPKFTYTYDKKTHTGCLQVIPKGSDFHSYLLFKGGESVVKDDFIKYDLGKKAVFKNDNIFVPMRAVLNVLGLNDKDIAYNSDDKSVKIIKGNDFITNIKKYLKHSYSGLSSIEDDSWRKEHTLYDDVYYHKGSKNYAAIVKYIKENFDSNFDVSDYTISEDKSYEDESYFDNYNSMSINYTIDGLRSDYGYIISIYGNRVLTISEMGTPISKDTLHFDKKDILSDEELCKKALEANDNDYLHVSKQSTDKWIDSASGKIKYVVDTEYRTDEGMYSGDFFEYMP